MSSARICVFCGREPESKTREHVLPQWLIEMTGHPKRIAGFGVSFVTGKERQFAFDQFTAPACSECNQVFGHLEAAAKPVLEGLLADHCITRHAVKILLDWLDKIRIGLWLTYWMLDKNAFGVLPKFAVLSRMGAKDRMVAIGHADDERRLNFLGPGLPAFQFTPSCFVLRVNQYSFFSLSADELLGPRLGFPMMVASSMREAGRGISVVHEPGSERVRIPLLRHYPVPVWSTAFYQPMIPEAFRSVAGTVFDTSYVRANCSDWVHGEGSVFVGMDRGVRRLDTDDERVSIPAAPREWTSTRLHLAFGADACLVLDALMDDHRWISVYEPEKRREIAKDFRAAKGVTRRVRHHVEAILKRYAERSGDGLLE